MDQPPGRNPRSEFRARLSSFVEEHPELDSGEAAEQFGRDLPTGDRGLVTEFLIAEARNILAWEMRAHFVRNRQGIYAALDISNPDRPAVADMVEQAKKSLYERIAQWREFVPSENRTRILGELDRTRLRESAQYDAQHVAHYGWKMLLKTKLADALPDDSTTVAQFYTPEQIATLGEKIRKDMTHGNFRLRVAPVRALPRPPSVPRQDNGRHAKGPEVDRGLAAG